MVSSQLSKMDSMLCATGRLNAPLETPFRDFLILTIGDARQHARFLNLLSLLEHRGSRKIMLSQMQGVLTQDILKHLAEETRHAFFFKREAEKLAGASIEGYADADTLCAASGLLYFGRLDAELTAALSPDLHREIPYLWVSLIVELRAIWVYRLYQDALTAAESSLSLKGIMAEEDRHLQDMIDRLDVVGFKVEGLIAAAQKTDNRLFEKLFSALQNAPAGEAPRGASAVA